MATNTRRSKALGYGWETAVKEFLIDTFARVKRNGNQYGSKDRGDLGGVPNWTLQCKNVQDDSWGVWFKATTTQAVNNKTRWWAVIRKMRGKGAAEALFVMSLSKGKELMAYLRELENENKKLRKQLGEPSND